MYINIETSQLPGPLTWTTYLPGIILELDLKFSSGWILTLTLDHVQPRSPLVGFMDLLFTAWINCFGIRSPRFSDWINFFRNGSTIFGKELLFSGWINFFRLGPRFFGLSFFFSSRISYFRLWSPILTQYFRLRSLLYFRPGQLMFDLDLHFSTLIFYFSPISPRTPIWSTFEIALNLNLINERYRLKSSSISSALTDYLYL